MKTAAMNVPQVWGKTKFCISTFIILLTSMAILETVVNVYEPTQSTEALEPV